MLKVFSCLCEIATSQMPSVTNPLLDENGDLVSTEEAVSKFSKLWEEWDPVNKLINAVPKIILAVVLVIVGLWLARIIPKLIVKALKAKNVDASVYAFVRNIISTLIKVAFLLFALSLFFNINSFLAAIGAVGITAGIGLKDSVSQFVSGIQILFNRQFKAGDYIAVDGQEGSVAEIRFMNTVIITNDNKRVIIPNSHITTNSLVNYSAEEKRRVDLTYSISYTDDISKARTAVLNAARSNLAVLNDPEPAVYVKNYGASSIDLVSRIWCKSEDYWNVYFYMQEEVKHAFDKNGINIPFDQLDVHIVKTSDDGAKFE